MPVRLLAHVGVGLHKCLILISVFRHHSGRSDGKTAQIRSQRDAALMPCTGMHFGALPTVCCRLFVFVYRHSCRFYMFVSASLLLRVLCSRVSLHMFVFVCVCLCLHTLSAGTNADLVSRQGQVALACSVFNLAFVIVCNFVVVWILPATVPN